MNSEHTCKVPKYFVVGLGLTFFNSWVLFEETIVDRHGWHELMPGYLVGVPCIWDASAALVITAFGIWVWRRQAQKLRRQL